jgi:hypothetical protein
MGPTACRQCASVASQEFVAHGRQERKIWRVPIGLKPVRLDCVRIRLDDWTNLRPLAIDEIDRSTLILLLADPTPTSASNTSNSRSHSDVTFRDEDNCAGRCSSPLVT